jgi:nitrite reductase/ring-hydroxylating ferredoxin subunit
MEWRKIFDSEQEARTKIKEHKPQLLIVDNVRICLTLHQGNFYAVQDSCTHHGESLSKGAVNSFGEIICPWHHYRFQLNGGMAMDSSCQALVSYSIKCTDSGFFIAI